MLYDSRLVADAASNPPRPAVDAVVITWNRWELSERCIEHLFASTVDVHVIVVDNGSEDGTPDRVRERFPQAELIEFSENRGYGAAANAGAERATAEFVSIVNSDALVAPDYFELVLARMRADDRVGFAAGLSINPATGLVDAAGAIFDVSLNWAPYLEGVAPEEAVVDEKVLGSPPSDALVFRRAAFARVGGFDSEIFAYGEDLDMTLRLRAAGWLAASVRGAMVEHLGSASLGKRTARQMAMVGWGRGYVAGRYRMSVWGGPRELLLWLAICASVRDITPLKRLFAGWRRGRSLPARPIPDGIYRESWSASIKKRIDAARR